MLAALLASLAGDRRRGWDGAACIIQSVHMPHGRDRPGGDHGLIDE